MNMRPALSQVREPAIRVRGLEKSYKKLRVLRGVDFEVARGRNLHQPLSGTEDSPPRS